MKRYDHDIEILPEPAADGTFARSIMVESPDGEYVKYVDVVRSLREIFDFSTIDAELWDELDKMDDGYRVNVPMTVMDLKRVWSIIDIDK